MLWYSTHPSELRFYHTTMASTTEIVFAHVIKFYHPNLILCLQTSLHS
jgi:hypothetical protein